MTEDEKKFIEDNSIAEEILKIRQQNLEEFKIKTLTLSPCTTGQEIPTVTMTDAEGSVTTTQAMPVIVTTSTDKKIDVILNGARIKNPA